MWLCCFGWWCSRCTRLVKSAYVLLGPLGFRITELPISPIPRDHCPCPVMYHRYICDTSYSSKLGFLLFPGPLRVKNPLSKRCWLTLTIENYKKRMCVSLHQTQYSNWIRHKVTENVQTRKEWEDKKRGKLKTKERGKDTDISRQTILYYRSLPLIGFLRFLDIHTRLGETKNGCMSFFITSLVKCTFHMPTIASCPDYHLISGDRVRLIVVE